ncbi:3-keto-5-aminohexanoate cleavage protein [Acinetobacter sp. ANC 3832]|uniref:3-keto-5-aminohexanoate cleavage protein n=1 Tax=Acinetobacter sp. ANC 3832 TaxID=1977874 RepID=UPI000A34A99B|nr:3-keto-5-aminohexanoate cleavage protein [Acinetobacter sp. ANC 3832]OTG91183.1 transposase [Acinetobacter sp. ANC 3832]
MYFLDDSLLPENQEKLVIQVAPYGPQWIPSDSNDIPVTFDEQVQKAVDCYNAGATVLHLHVRETDGKGSKKMSQFNKMIESLQQAVPEMIIQVGGSISFAPEDEGAAASWLDYDTRHMLAELNPKPDQVTIAINSSQMNLCEIMSADDIAGTILEKPEYHQAYSEMVVDAKPSFFIEHLKRLQANDIQPHFMLGNIHQLETVDRLIRKGIYTGPLNLNYVAIAGGSAGIDPSDLIQFTKRCPAGSILTYECLMRSVLPMNTMAIALGMHVRVGIEDNLWGRKSERMSSVQQVEKTVRVARELYRDVATAKEAREIYKIGKKYKSAEETIHQLGMAPNRKLGQRGFTVPGH